MLLVIRYKLNDVTQIAFQCVADLYSDLGIDIFVVPHLRNGGSANAGYGGQILLLQILVDQELPKFLIANNHNQNLQIKYLCFHFST